MSDSSIFGLIVAACLALVVAVVAVDIHEQKKWDAFKATHSCKVVAHISGDVFNTIGVSGNGQVAVGIGSTPDKTGWLCDNGVTYYK